MDAQMHQRIGDYEILDVLGSGGMGKVYRVRNVISDRIEAMKVLLPDLAGRQELADRFLREIKLLASLNHPNIATLCTALTIDNQLVMIMEFVEGKTIDQLLDHGQISLECGTSYIDQTLKALSYAHQKGIIHRDIKPANMMLTNDGVIKLMDFGIARSGAERGLTQTGTTLGSVNYMSPEQIMGKPVDARSDIYSTGVSLYEIATGQRPFSANSDYELMAMHVREVPRAPIELRPWLPAALNQIILTAIAKEPQDRFSTAEEFRQALQKAQGAMETAPLPVQRARAATVVEPSGSTPVFAGTELIASAPMRDRTQVVVQGTSSQVGQSAALATRPASSPAKKVYIAAGAVLALAAVGTPAVRMLRHHDTSQPAVTSPSTPNDSAKAPGGGGGTPPVQPPAKPIVKAVPPTHASGTKPPNMPPKQVGAQIAVATPPAPQPQQPPTAISPELQDRLDQLEMRIDHAGTESVGINNSLINMQAQMQKEGLALRSDVVSEQASMNLSLAEAEKALQAHDADRAGKFVVQAETDIAALKKFLGR
jgi:eukaryotic-like serine/threonine-protein kinase